MSLTQLIALSVLAAALALLLRDSGAKGGTAVIAVGGIALFAFALTRYAAPVETLRELAEEAGLSGPIAALLKMLGVGWLSRLGGDVCRDMGAPTLGARLELCGRAEIILLCLPLLVELCGTVREVLA